MGGYSVGPDEGDEQVRCTRGRPPGDAALHIHIHSRLGSHPATLLPPTPLPPTPQATIGDCCASCAATPGCNAWRYCSQKGGCRMPDRTLFKYGYCALLRSGEVASGQAPSYQVGGCVRLRACGAVLPRAGSTVSTPAQERCGRAHRPPTRPALPAGLFRCDRPPGVWVCDGSPGPGAGSSGCPCHHPHHPHHCRPGGRAAVCGAPAVSRLRTAECYNSGTTATTGAPRRRPLSSAFLRWLSASSCYWL